MGRDNAVLYGYVTSISLLALMMSLTALPRNVECSTIPAFQEQHFSPSSTSPQQLPGKKPKASIAAIDRIRGVGYVTWGMPNSLLAKPSDDQMRRLRDLGVNYITLRIGWLQESYDATDIHPGYATPTDDSVRHVVRLCHKMGMKTMIVLLVDLEDPMRGGSSKWRGQIDPDAGQAVSQGWQKWFASYEKFALHYAKLSQEVGVNLLCMGCELTSATERFDQPWRGIIRKIREVYRGPVTYQANWSPLYYTYAVLGAAGLLKDQKWNAEYRTVKFWDALDYAALCSYFSLTDKPDPPLQELEDNLRIWRDELRDWQKSIGKPVIFAEVGYQSADGSAIEPWRTPLNTRSNPQLQARCYEAFLKTFSSESWVMGLFWWFAYPPGEWGVDDGGRGFPFLGKPAEEVVHKWFSSPSR